MDEGDPIHEYPNGVAPETAFDHDHYGDAKTSADVSAAAIFGALAVLASVFAMLFILVGIVVILASGA